MIKLSATIITLNAGLTIRQTLESVKWCHEIVIVDSGSTDNTLEICKQYNCKIHSNPFPGYGQQKNLAASLASNDWILSIDADEVLSPELQQEIQDIFNQSTILCNGYYIPRSLVFMNRVFRFGEGKKPILRIYNKNSGSFNTPLVHETLIVKGETKQLTNTMLHYSYVNLHDYLEKFNRYTTGIAQDLNNRGKSKSLPGIIVRVPFEFLKLYIFKGFILEGYPGFAWASLSSFYTLVKYIKLKELQLNK